MKNKKNQQLVKSSNKRQQKDIVVCSSNKVFRKVQELKTSQSKNVKFREINRRISIQTSKSKSKQKKDYKRKAKKQKQSVMKTKQTLSSDNQLDKVNSTIIKVKEQNPVIQLISTDFNSKMTLTVKLLHHVIRKHKIKDGELDQLQANLIKFYKGHRILLTHCLFDIREYLDS